MKLSGQKAVAEKNKNPLGAALLFFLGLVFVIPAVLIVYASDESQNQPSFLVRVIELVVRAFFVVIFLVAYRKKLTLAWWTAMLFFPTTVLVGLIFYANLFSWKTLAIYLTMCLVFMFYLVRIYRPYKSFIDKASTESLKTD